MEDNAESLTGLYRFPVCRVDYVDFHSCFVAVSKDIFIGDIDTTSYEGKAKAITAVKRVEAKLNLAFRIYVTFSGIRFIEISRRFDLLSDSDIVNQIFDATACDLAYVEMCSDTKTFRARLTPKQGRNELQVCIPVLRGKEYAIQDQEIKEFVFFHDLLTTR